MNQAMNEVSRQVQSTPLIQHPRVGVGALIVRNNQILLAKRRGSHGAGTFGSVGGHLEFGETPEVALKREAMEQLEIGSYGFEPMLDSELKGDDRTDVLRRALRVPKADRLWYIGDAFREGMSVADVHEYTGIEPWFLAEIEDLIRVETSIAETSPAEWDKSTLFGWKQKTVC